MTSLVFGILLIPVVMRWDEYGDRRVPSRKPAATIQRAGVTTADPGRFKNPLSVG